MRSPLSAFAVAALLTGLLAGCGGPVDDLFAVDRSGTIPGARLSLVVNDEGTVRCNGKPAQMLPASLLIEARELQRALVGPTHDEVRLKDGPQTVLRYRVRTPSGSVSFADDSRAQRPVFFRLAFFVRKVAKGVCHLAR